MPTQAVSLNKGAIQRIGADLVHQYNKGTGVRIGILSNGIMPHIAYKNQIKGGWDFVNDTALSDISGDPASNHRFATFAAGLIAGGGPLGTGILGVAPEAHLYDLRIADAEGLSNWDRMVAAVNWAVENQIEVLCIEVGSFSNSQALSDALDRAYQAGIVTVAPVGSTYASWTGVDKDWPSFIASALFPARHPKVIGAAEIEHGTDRPDHWRRIWDKEIQKTLTYRLYHARDGSTELVAPGGNTPRTWDSGVGSTYGVDSDTFDAGTHVAAAIVAGVAALVIAGGWAVTVADIRQRLRDTATKLSSEGLGDVINQKIYGHGLVNALLAAPPKSVAPSDVEGQREELGIGADGLGDIARVTTLANISPRVTVPVDPIPYITKYPSPRNGETNVPINNPIKFTLKSDTSGIDISAVRVKINGEVYKYGDPGFSFTGNRHGYDIEVRRPSASDGWGYEETVNVEIEAWDLAGKPGLVYERMLG
ncbi:MAG: S8 family serine peptidase [Candidatus Brocadiales bacterium]